MIIDSLVYVIGKGYVDPSEISPGDEVYKLKKNIIERGPVEQIQSDFLSSKVNVVSSGQFSSLSTDDTRFLFVNGYSEYTYLKWDEISSKTRDKAYNPNMYLPVLTTMDKRGKTYSDSDLDGWARAIAIDQYDVREALAFLKSLTGVDNYIFIELLENWLSFEPGKGYGFSKVLVKGRMFIFSYKAVAQEICRVANFAGWTADLQYFENKWFVAINFEATPSLGSIPKTQKYYKESYTGMVYNVNAGNSPVLGRTAYNKYCFIPSVSTLWGDLPDL